MSINNDYYTNGIDNLEAAKYKSAITRVLLLLFPYHLLKQIQFETHMLLVRLRSRNITRAYEGKRDLLVNIGAGSLGKEGWINLDGFLEKNVNCLYDARKCLPFPTNSVRGIFTEHFFEHLDYIEEAPLFLSECYRVLQKGSVLRIIIPDGEKYLKAYGEGRWQDLTELRQIEHNTIMEQINAAFRQGQQHKFSYDFETTDFILKRNGFQDVRKQAFGRSVMPEICIDNPVRAPESLYVEAIK
jgi:predicted SAM-dependent methyltransferase